MPTEKMRTYTLAEMKDAYIGTLGTKERDEYEYELRMDVLGRMIKAARQERDHRHAAQGVQGIASGDKLQREDEGPAHPCNSAF